MKLKTTQRKKAMSGFKQMTGEEQARQALFDVIAQGKQALDATFMDMGRMLAESIMLIEREELAGPDYHPKDPNLQKWAHEPSSVYLADQKIKVSKPRLRDRQSGEVPLTSYQAMRQQGQFSEALLEKILRGVSAQKYEDTVMESASAFGISPSSVSRKLVTLTAQKLKEFKGRPLVDFDLFAMFLDTIHRGGEAFLVGLGIDRQGNKLSQGFWQGSSENHEICEELFQDLERRGLQLCKRVIFQGNRI